MGVLDRDYIIYVRYTSGAMKTVLRHINASGKLKRDIAVKDLENDPELIKIIRNQLQDGAGELMREPEAVRSCIDWEDLDKRIEK